MLFFLIRVQIADWKLFKNNYKKGINFKPRMVQDLYLFLFFHSFISCANLSIALVSIRDT